MHQERVRVCMWQPVVINCTVYMQAQREKKMHGKDSLTHYLFVLVAVTKNCMNDELNCRGSKVRCIRSTLRGVHLRYFYLIYEFIRFCRHI